MMDWPILILLLLFAGLVLLLLEIFVVPGFGPVGIGAILFLAIGTYLSWTKLSIIWGIGATFGSILSVILSIIFLKKSGVTKRFILGKSVGEKDEADNQEHGQDKDMNTASIDVGDTGIAMSDLRPSGIAEIKGKRINVIADGIYIKRGTGMKVVNIQGNRIFVEEIK